MSLISCKGCGSSTIQQEIDLGYQPPSNRYLAQPDTECETHPLQFGYCTICGLAQLINPMPVETAQSRFSWISYNEPEGHLDNLVERLLDLVGNKAESQIIGVTYKDDSTLARLKKHGVAHTYRLSQADDLNIIDPLASLEAIQSAFAPELANKLREQIGQADILIARHILEHAHFPAQFLEACQTLTKEGGYMVFEAPDCRKVMDGCDHCFLWEEHITYLTTSTLETLLEHAGLSEYDIQVYSYPMEDSLVAIVRNTQTATNPPQANVEDIHRVERFCSSLIERKDKIKQHLQSHHEAGKKIALFGAGHLAAKFINFYGLAPFIFAVIDDSPDKQGLFMPGSGVPIVGSKSLDKDCVDICLLALSPESEQKVLKLKTNYLNPSGYYRSIFSASSNSIDLDIHDDSAQ